EVFALGEAVASPYPVGFRSAMCDLTLSLRARPGGGYDAEFEYATALFDPATVTPLAADLLGLLDAAAADPHRALPLGGTAGLAGGELAPVASIPELFAAAVSAAPDAVAVVDATASERPLEFQQR